MSDLVAIEDGEVVFAVFRLEELVFDIFGSGADAVGLGDFNVDLLDLERDVVAGEESGVDDEGGVEVDVVEVHWEVLFGEDADDEDVFAEEGDGLADGGEGAEEAGGEVVADDAGVFGVGIIQEYAGFEGEVFESLEVGGGGENGGGVERAGAFQGGDGDGDGGDGLDVLDGGDDVDVI